LSSLPGGAADKNGNRYERWWTLLRLADVLSGKAECMRLEPPGTGGAGIEFWVEEAGVRWCEQVKDASARGSWTPRRLTAEGVLPSLKGHLAEGYEVRLVLSSQADKLGTLASRARAATTLTEYTEVLTRDQRPNFEELAAIWEVDEATAWQYLRRVHVEHHSPEQLRRLVHATYGRLVQGDPEVVANELRGWLDDMLHKTLTTSAVWAHLEAKGFLPAATALPPRRRRWHWAAAVAVALAGAALVAVKMFFPGGDVRVPNLAGLPPDQACTKLKDVKLVCLPVGDEATPEINIVHAQNPDVGAPVPKGTGVRYTYGSVAPVLLLRFQAPAPGQAELISLATPGLRSWVEKSPSPGRVYPVYRVGERGLPGGLVTIYQFHCVEDCKENPTYWFGMGTAGNKSWKFDREAFRCFDPATPQPIGTQPLYALRHPETYARRWALQNTPEFKAAMDAGFKKDSGPPLCYIWPA
jgi:hypothetical protein